MDNNNWVILGNCEDEGTLNIKLFSTQLCVW